MFRVLVYKVRTTGLIRDVNMLGLVTHAFYPITWEAETEGAAHVYDRPEVHHGREGTLSMQ